jgi:hypothetical protein
VPPSEPHLFIDHGVGWCRATTSTARVQLPTGRYAVRFTMRQSELYGIES